MTNSKHIQEIIEGCKKSNPKSQQAFVKEFSGFLYAICKRYIKDTEFAKDKVQESLFKILDKIHLYDNSKGKIESWISTIAIRTCLSSFAKKRITTVNVDEVYSEEVQFDARILGELTMQELYALIHKLPFMYREVFNLHVIDGYSHVEIGELLNIKTSSSRSRLFRAKAMLKENILFIKKQESWAKAT